MSAQRIYLDNVASTPLKREVLDKIKESFEYYGNPSSVHSFGRSAKALIEKARKNIAKELGVSPSEIIFTSGATEANNMILRGAIRDLGVTHIVTSLQEHHSVLHTAQAIENEYGTKISYIRITNDGTPDLVHLEKILVDFSAHEKILVSLMHINNETGYIQPLQKIATLCKKYKVYFHSDAVQSVGHYSLELSNIDFITASAHKFYGPKGVGFAYINKNTGLNPFIFGGEQERGMRGGTEALHNIVGLEQAFMLAYESLEKEQKHLLELKSYFIEELVKHIPKIRFNGISDDLEKSSHSILNIGLPTEAQKSDIVLLYLDMKGIACSKGSACQSGSEQISHVLKTFLTEKELRQSNLRFSFSVFNTKQEIDYVIQVLKDFVK